MRPTYLSLLLMLFVAPSLLMGQSPAALNKLQLKYNFEQLEEMRLKTHHKYEGLILFYSSSFLVVENGQSRAATENEIAAINLDSYNSQRSATSAVTVHDVSIGMDLLLMSRNEFEQLVLHSLSEADAAAYLTYKVGSTTVQEKSNE